MAGEQKTSAGLRMGQMGFCLHCLGTPNPPRLTASVSNALWGTMKDRNMKMSILVKLSTVGCCRAFVYNPGQHYLYAHHRPP